MYNKNRLPEKAACFFTVRSYAVKGARAARKSSQSSEPISSTIGSSRSRLKMPRMDYASTTYLRLLSVRW